MWSHWMIVNIIASNYIEFLNTDEKYHILCQENLNCFAMISTV